ncbi:phospholipid/cholesterol/gamma-HCH transport system substrate-binding protein [Sphingomonas jejuensis]|uniref:Phospholipid/cholesterol/gamma-HCH transport system substrate-binding protein n=1 Tax=Sphingomonas jejuensis TaxID=904715 RepID=A0ABX0XL90_9SPHN|nr:MlaD family protein [Sphingomonas jejuensis]NJC33923.1 phospholipid/cholesterol/gamma-HCH transport system substrate-binding protein [Sphingomonas jejuensis]
METRSNNVLVGAVTLILLAGVVIFAIWLANLSGTRTKDYDIFFRTSVEGLAKGSTVTFSGVPSGQVESIGLWANNPELVRVRIAVRDDLPVLQGTTAQIQSSFTGTSTIQLAGARQGAPAIDVPGPAGVPVIPTRPGALGELLNSAPQLLERLTTLTERLTGLLSDRNQASIAGILDNTNRLTDALADRGPEIAATLAQTRVAIQQAGDAAEQIGQLAATTNSVLDEDTRPLIRELQRTVSQSASTFDNLNAAINDARPGLQAFSQRTIPEAGLLVRDLRETTEALSAIADRVNNGGASSLIGRQRLPDYEPK